MSSFRISVLALQGDKLTFTVPAYEIIEGDFIKFLDLRTNKIKIFHASRCEIEEINIRGDSCPR